MVDALAPADEHVIRIGAWRRATARNATQLRMTGLGSCVGLVLLDKTSRTLAVAHVFLPTQRKPGAGEDSQYADRVVPFLLSHMPAASRANIVAVMAGGASMFAHVRSDVAAIGANNQQNVRAALADAHIPIACDVCGGNQGVSMFIDPVRGQVSAKPTGQPMQVLVESWDQI